MMGTIRRGLRLLAIGLLAACAVPFAAAQYETYQIYPYISSLPAGSYGGSLMASVNDSSATLNFNICFYTGYGNTAPIVPSSYISYGSFGVVSFSIPPSSIQDVLPSAFTSGSFSALIYTVPTFFSSCTGSEQSLGNASTFTLNYPTLSAISLPSLPDQNPNLTTRLPSRLSLTGTNFLSNSGTSGSVPSAVSFTSSTTVAGAVTFVSSNSLASTIPASIPATATSVDVEVCNTAVYSYCSNTLTLKTRALQSSTGRLTATPNPALPTQPVSLSATFTPASPSVAGAPSGLVSFHNGSTTLGSSLLALDKTAMFVASPVTSILSFNGLMPPPLVADFNKDGIPDFLFLENGSSTLHLLLGTDPSGSFAPDAQISIQDDGPTITVLDGAVADVNNDGYPDVVLLCQVYGYNGTYNTIYTLLNDGTGNLSNFFNSYDGTIYGSHIVAGDFNHDGKQDIVLSGAIDSDGDAGLQPLFGDGTGNFILGPATPGLDTLPDYNFGDFKIVAADFNGDGYADVAVMNGANSSGGLDTSIEVYQNNGKGLFNSPVKIHTDGTSNAGFLVAPLGPGRAPDILVTSAHSTQGGISVALNESTPTKIAFSNTLVATKVPGFLQTVVGDFNGDGFLDAAVDNGTIVRVYSGDGSGAFSTQYTSLSTPSVVNTVLVAASDENGDTYADLLTLSNDGTVNSDYTSYGLHDFVTAGTATATLVPTDFAVGTYRLAATTPGTYEILGTTAATNLVVNAVTPTVSLTTSPHSPVNYGPRSVELIASIPDPTATGTISFYNGRELLGSARLVDGTAAVADFTPALLAAGTYSFKAVYGGDANHTSASSFIVPFQINPISATITWIPNPATITYGTPLSSAQLDAVATGLGGAAVAGSFAYAPGPGTILPAGADTVVATYTPSDPNYVKTTASTTITVTQATPTVTWIPNPATITYGTPLSGAQLDATSSTQGIFTYTPALGAVLAAGTQTLSTTFTPTNTTDFKSVTSTVTITVTQATPIITWNPNPATITYGTPLSAGQLDATSNTGGMFVYNPVLGTVLSVGTQTLSVTFTPTDSTDFTTATKSVSIVVLQGGLTLSPTSLQFGNVAFGSQSAAQVVTVTNPGTSAIDITNIDSEDEPNPEDFIPTSNCPAALAPNASCQISVTFKPDGVGPKSGDISIFDDSNPSSQFIPVSGTGTGGILQVNPGNLKTIAGNGVAGYQGDGGPGTAAELNQPNGVAFDPQGNLYIADQFNNVVRKVDTAGNITTFAGTGTQGHTGDGGPATNATLSNPFSVTSDTAGNIFIQDTGNDVIRKVDTSGVITTFAGTGQDGHSGDGGPATMATFALNQGARFDSAGNLYVPQCRDASVRKIDTQGIITTVAGNFTPGYSGDGGLATSAQLQCPSGVTIDAAGNFYIADYFNQVIRKVDTHGIITTFAGTGTAGATGDGGPALSATFNLPNDVMLDPGGDLFIADSGNNRIRKIDTNGIVTTAAGGLNDAGSAIVNTPSAVTLNATGFVFFSDSGNQAVREIYPQSTAPFPPTAVGATAAAQTVTLSNVGNVPIVIPSRASFTLGGNASDFSLSGGTCLQGATLATNESTCTLQISFAPIAVGPRTLTVSIADNALNSPQSFTIGGTGTAGVPTIAWSAPASIVYGTPLSSTQLDAVASGINGIITGTYDYTPPAGTILTAGAHTLSVLFTATDPNYSTATASVPITVIQATPSVTWNPNPSTIAYGTPLTGAQLDATSTTAGTFTYTPALGAVLAPGVQTLSATFTPTDTTDFKSVTTTTTITVTQATPIVTWIPNPATITYGTALTAAQLDATSTTLGSFTYSPALGTVLGAGTQTLSSTFTPTNTTDFKPVTTTTTITVTQATPIVTWTPNPSTIVYGTPLTAGQLDATSATSGSFTYNPALGAVLAAGTQTLSATFTPTDTTDFKSVTSTTTITVTQATPTVTWTPNPSTITYGTALTAAQLDANSTAPGSFTYNPALGTILGVGTQTLSATFTPTNATDFKSVTTTTTITVTQATPTVTWTPNPSTITYGTALTAAQLDATSATSGIFTYSPALGTVLGVGTQTLSATFTPTNTTDFKSVTTTTTITITQATPTVTWTPNPSTISYGTALVASQLDATSPTPGTFAYNPTLGAVLAAGTQTLTATFTPTDTTDFRSVISTTTITVTQATPTVTWAPNPSTITYGTALTAAQLDAISATPGSFTYNPALGTVLGAGTQTLSSTFTPTNTTDFKPVTTTTTITVTQATPTVTWTPNPSTIAYGTALTAAQLDAISATPGSFTYNPALGTVLGVGTQTLSAVFTPTNSTNFKSVTTTTTITVTQGTPTVTWTPNPATITYGTALTVAQLDAISSTPGSFSYNPGLGTVLGAGTQTLSATFTPTNTTNFKPVTTTTTITVTQATPAITWTPNPSTILYGTALTAAQLNAVSNTPGSFTYSPAPGTVLSAGTQTLTAVFTPNNTANFKSISATVTITVTQATPTLTWATPASVVAGTKLSSTQLDATATGVTGAALAGTFTYTPPAGTALTGGTQKLTVLFTPSDLVDYTTATANVSISVISVTLTSISSSTASLGDPAKTITLTGTGFDSTAVAQVNGTTVPTTLVNSTTLSAVIPATNFLTVQVLQISVFDAAQNFTTPSLPLSVTAPTPAAVFSGPSLIPPLTQSTLNFALDNPYPVDLTATFTLTFTPASGLSDDPNLVFSTGGRTLTTTIPAGSTTLPNLLIQGGTVAGSITVTLVLQAGGVTVTPSSIQPLTIQEPFAVPGITSVTFTTSGNTLTVLTRGFSNTREMSSAKFHFTPAQGASLGTQDLTIDVGSIFATWFSSPESTQYGSEFTFTQIFNLSSDATVVGQVSVILINDQGGSPEANSP